MNKFKKRQGLAIVEILLSIFLLAMIAVPFYSKIMPTLSSLDREMSKKLSLHGVMNTPINAAFVDASGDVRAITLTTHPSNNPNGSNSNSILYDSLRALSLSLSSEYQGSEHFCSVAAVVNESARPDGSGCGDVRLIESATSLGVDSPMPSFGLNVGGGTGSICNNDTGFFPTAFVNHIAKGSCNKRFVIGVFPITDINKDPDNFISFPATTIRDLR